LQNRRLRDVLKRALEKPVPFFERKLKEAGIADARDVRGVGDIEKLPLTIKQELRDSETAVPPVGDYRYTDIRDCIRIGTSTGTTGTPTVMLWTRHDANVEYECAARMWWRQGVRPGQIVTHAHPAYLYAGGPMLQSAYEYFGVLSIWVPPPDTDEAAEQGIRMWLRIQPDVPFVGFSLGRFFEVSAKLGLDPFKDVGMKIPSMPGGGMPLSTAGAECAAFLGTACEERNGGHMPDDFAIVEAVDPATGKQVPDGEWGDLVCTAIGRDNCLIRYDLEEACKVEHAPCPCGENTSRAWWGGRYKDLMSVQGKRLQFFDVEGALRSVPGLAQPSLEYQVVRPKDEREALRVRVEPGAGMEDKDDIRTKVTGAFKERLGVEATVDVLDRDTLPRSGYKTQRVVDE
jgi:phenylacetate-CoA ligase